MHDQQMSTLKAVIPTYNAVAFADKVEAGEVEEFGSPHVPILIKCTDDVRIVLGTHDHDDMSKPDIFVERRPNGWAIFLHPLGGGDPSGYLYFLDDGRSILWKEREGGSTPPIEIRPWNKEVDEVDMIDEPAPQLASDDDILNAFATEIEAMEAAIGQVRDQPARLRLRRIANHLTAILRAI